MSTNTKDWFQRLALIAGLLTGTGALAWTSFLVTLPARVDAQDKRLERIESDRKSDRELLVRIEERLIAVQSEIRRQPSTPIAP